MTTPAATLCSLLVDTYQRVLQLAERIALDPYTPLRARRPELLPLLRERLAYYRQLDPAQAGVAELLTDLSVAREIQHEAEGNLQLVQALRSQDDILTN